MRLTQLIKKHSPVGKISKRRSKELLEKVDSLYERVIEPLYTLKNLDISNVGRGEMHSIMCSLMPMGPSTDYLKSLEDSLSSLSEEIGIFRECIRYGDCDLLIMGTDNILLNSNKNDSIDAYHNVYNLLADNYEKGVKDMVLSPHKDMILMKYIAKECSFTNKAKDTDFNDIGPGVKNEFKFFASSMQRLFNLDIQGLFEEYLKLVAEIRDTVPEKHHTPETRLGTMRFLPSLSDFEPRKDRDTLDQNRLAKRSKSQLLRQSIAGFDDWSLAIEDIAAYYKQTQLLEQGEYLGISKVQTLLGPSFRLTDRKMRKRVTLESLVGISDVISKVEKNVEFLMADRPKNHVYLYGPKGTGKSSLVNGLLDKYHEDGLKVIEVSRDTLPLLPQVYSEIEGNESKYIFLVDEFDIAKDQYGLHQNKDYFDHLKKMIEGSFEGLPDNSMLFVISNTRENMHLRDAYYGEGHSLEDRFGLILNIDTPDEKALKDILRQKLIQYEVCQEDNLKNGNLELQYKQFQSYCKDKNIARPNGRNARDFAITMQQI